MIWFSVGEHHVGRLQIAMDDPFLVRRFEGVEHLPGMGDGFVKRHRASLQPRGQRLAVDELENQVARLAGVGDFEPVDRADVRVAQCGEDLRFAFEPGDAFGVVRDEIRQGLDGDVAVQSRVAGFVDLAHSPRAKLGLDLVGPDCFSNHARIIASIERQDRQVRRADRRLGCAPRLLRRPCGLAHEHVDVADEPREDTKATILTWNCQGKTPKPPHLVKTRTSLRDQPLQHEVRQRHGKAHSQAEEVQNSIQRRAGAGARRCW